MDAYLFVLMLLIILLFFLLLIVIAFKYFTFLDVKYGAKHHDLEALSPLPALHSTDPEAPSTRLDGSNNTAVLDHAGNQSRSKARESTQQLQSPNVTENNPRRMLKERTKDQLEQLLPRTYRQKFPSIPVTPRRQPGMVREEPSANKKNISEDGVIPIPNTYVRGGYTSSPEPGRGIPAVSSSEQIRQYEITQQPDDKVKTTSSQRGRQTPINTPHPAYADPPGPLQPAFQSQTSRTDIPNPTTVILPFRRVERVRRQPSIATATEFTPGMPLAAGPDRQHDIDINPAVFSSSKLRSALKRDPIRDRRQMSGATGNILISATQEVITSAPSTPHKPSTTSKLAPRSTNKQLPTTPIPSGAEDPAPVAQSHFDTTSDEEDLGGDVRQSLLNTEL